MIRYYDIHTHHSPAGSEDFAVVNVIVYADTVCEPILNSRLYSAGIHPWYMEDIEKQILTFESIISLPNVIAIGESGLDKLANTPLTQQLELFEAIAALAEKAGKPLIIHCVKAWTEIMAAKKQLKPTVPWIIHGFRGNGELGKQLIRQGFFLSFGEYFNPEAVRSAWPGHLLAETDDRNINIRIVYDRLAEALAIPLEQFAKQIEKNVYSLFSLSS